MIENLPALLPLHFFTVALEAKEGKKLKLPKMADLLGEEYFADVDFVWSKKGIEIGVKYNKPFEEAAYPEFSKGEAVELFFDTRDLKTAGFATKFCHRFLFLPKEVQGIQCQELSHFRTEDSHPLCDSALLSCKAEFSKGSFTLAIFIPSEALFGYDPGSFDRIGFTYRMHAVGREPQHFSVSSKCYKIEQTPNLWSSIKLI